MMRRQRMQLSSSFTASGIKASGASLTHLYSVRRTYRTPELLLHANPYSVRSTEYTALKGCAVQIATQVWQFGPQSTHPTLREHHTPQIT